MGLFTQDDKIQSWVQKNKNTTASNIADDAKIISNYSLPAMGAFGLYSFIAQDDKAQRTFLLSAESYVITEAFTYTLKYATGRYRPYTGHSSDTWYGTSFSGDEHMSFPSGEASGMFAMASVVASEYDNWVVSSLVYTAATLVALERVYDNDHWSSDVFIGSAMGYFIGKAVVYYHSKKKESKLSLIPLFNGKDVGLIMTYRF